MNNHKNIGGNHMSLTRRFGLLAGSSLLAVGLAALTPGAALAQTATCTSGTTVSGNGSPAVTIAAGNPNNPGITCNYTGDTATVTTLGAITVSTTANPPLNGVNLTASGSDDINWTSTAGTITGGAQTNGPVIDARTASGTIRLSTGAVAGSSSSTATHGIYAQSASGAIEITTGGSVSAPTGSTSTGQYGIEAVTTGNVKITAGGAVTGRLAGIRANTASGGGAIEVTLNSGASSVNTQSGSGSTIINAGTSNAAITAVTGAGALTINRANVNSALGISNHQAINATTGSGPLLINTMTGSVTTNAGGDATINITAVPFNSGNTTSTATLNMTAAAGTTTTVNNDGHLGGGQTASGSAQAQSSSITTVGGGAGMIVINNHAWMRGRVDFSASGGVVMNHEGGEWHATGYSEFSAAQDIVNIAADGVVYGVARIATGRPTATPDASTWNFGGASDDELNIAPGGTLVVGTGITQLSNLGQPEPGPSVLVLENLETFTNAGTIRLGAQQSNYQIDRPLLGGASAETGIDDILQMTSGDYVGAGGSIWFNVSLLSTPQYDCTRLADGTLPAADCVDFRGVSTSGETLVNVRDIAFSFPGAYNPEGIVLIDVEGGSSTAEHFALDPSSDHYDASRGIIDKGMFAYRLVYDDVGQKHLLVGAPDFEALQFAPIAQAAQALWYVSTGTWFDRQADLRGRMGDGVGGSVWIRGTADVAERDLVQSIQSFGTTFDIDNSYRQDSWAASIGIDLVSASTGDQGFVAGAMVGYAHSDVDFEDNPTTDRYSGFTGGAYASYVAGGFYLDGTVNAAGLTVDRDAPSLLILPAGTLITANIESVGGQVESGWRIPLGGFFVEPLASLAYVQTKFEDVTAPAPDQILDPGIVMTFDDAISLRGALGARIGTDFEYGGLRTQFSLLGRVWNEFEGKNDIVIDNIGADLPFSDDFSGQFSEVRGGMNVSDASGVLSAVLNAGVKFKDGYQATNVSAGFRWRW